MTLMADSWFCLLDIALEYQNVKLYQHCLEYVKQTRKFDSWSNGRGGSICIRASQISSAPGLEADDDICDLHVSLLLQVSQDSSSEEDLTLANAVQVLVQFQGFDLTR